MEKTILLTGGAGFIGSNLGEILLKKGYKILCLDNFNDFYDPQIKRKNIQQSLKHKNYHLIEGDILNESLVNSLFNRFKISKVVHLAAIAGVRPSIVLPQGYIDCDIKGTVNLLEGARKSNNTEQFIFASSSSVYGEDSEPPFSEEARTDSQISPYACAKKSAELYCRTYHNLYQLPIVILRFFTVYGPRQRPEMAIHKFIRHAFLGKEFPIPIYGDGSSKRDYTYIDDIIEGIINSLERNFNFEIFNLGKTETISLKNLISLVEKKVGKKIFLKIQPLQLGDVSITHADITKAREMLDYDPKISIEEGIEKFVEWYKKNYF